MAQSTKKTKKNNMSYEDMVLQDMNEGLENSSRNIYAETLFSASELRPRDTMNIVGGCPVRLGYGY